MKKDIIIIIRNVPCNSYLENYNLYMKSKLGKKYNLNWFKFMRFFKRTRDKLTINTNKNLEYYSKFTKFKKSKFTENIVDNKSESDKDYEETEFEDFDILENYDNNLGKVTNFKWLVYQNNSCRYDSYITLFYFCLYDYLISIKLAEGSIIKSIINLLDKLNYSNLVEIHNSIWKLMINSKINILSTEIENRNNYYSGYGKSGYISQLFNIFKNNNIFCITEEKKEI